MAEESRRTRLLPCRVREQSTIGGDGVVKYESAHIEGVESELVVRFGHSVQGQPKAIEEVRRILPEHPNASEQAQLSRLKIRPINLLTKESIC